MKDILKALIIVLSFSFLNGLIIYVTTSIRYNAASPKERAARYVNEPDFLQSAGLSIILIAFLYAFFRVVTFFIKKYKVWLMCSAVLLLNMLILCLFASLATDVFTLQMFVNFLLTWGINFFIPLADRLVHKRLYKANTDTNFL